MQTVATGEIGKRPLIQLWDSETSTLKGTAKSSKIRNGVAALGFSPKGDFLVAVGINTNHNVEIIRTKNMIPVANTKGGPDMIIDICWTSDKEFVTVGPKNYQIWTYNK